MTFTNSKRLRDLIAMGQAHEIGTSKATSPYAADLDNNILCKVNGGEMESGRTNPTTRIIVAKLRAMVDKCRRNGYKCCDLDTSPDEAECFINGAGGQP